MPLQNSALPVRANNGQKEPRKPPKTRKGKILRTRKGRIPKSREAKLAWAFESVRDFVSRQSILRFGEPAAFIFTAQQVGTHLSWRPRQVEVHLRNLHCAGLIVIESEQRGTNPTTYRLATSDELAATTNTTRKPSLLLGSPDVSTPGEGKTSTSKR